MTATTNHDVIVIGAGPSGSTAAAFLAEKGRRVLVLEKEKFPRYHVGESLMPFCWFTLERLGVLARMQELGFTQKYSVQFVSQDGAKSQPFYFFQHYDHPSSVTWQVNRDEFDLMLMENAVAKGAQVLQETKVQSLLKSDTGQVIGVSTENRDGQNQDYFAPITIDATGRDSLAVAKQDWRERDPKLNKIAIWTYFRGSKRDPGLDAGSTTVAYLPGKGWFWYIPLKGDVTSVGVVAERDYLFRDTRDLAEIFAREVENNAWIKEHVSEGQQFGQYWVTGEYSYRSRHGGTDGLVLVGDAFGFLDPVFSSGVFFALKSGELAAKHVDEALSEGDPCAARFDAYADNMCQGIEIMRKIVYAFYDEGFNFGALVRKYPNLRGDLTDCLIGNLEGKDFGPLMDAMRDFARLPEDLPYGRQGLSIRGAA